MDIKDIKEDFYTLKGHLVYVSRENKKLVLKSPSLYTSDYRGGIALWSESDGVTSDGLEFLPKLDKVDPFDYLMEEVKMLSWFIRHFIRKPKKSQLEDSAQTSPKCTKQPFHIPVDVDCEALPFHRP